MPTKRLFVPDDIIYPGTTDKNIRLLQYVNATGQENFDAFLTHHALVYILTGMKQIKTAQSQFNIHPGELLLIPRGEYVMSEYIAGESGFQSIMLFFQQKSSTRLGRTTQHSFCSLSVRSIFNAQSSCQNYTS